ncbi:MAG: acyltransferase [Pontixanthobacter sp.]
MGVDFFFILSGFVMAFSSEGKAVSQFFESRFFRIWPTFFICMSATAITLHLHGVRHFSPLEYIGNLSVLPAYLGIKYYDGVYWTVACEILFYAVVFALVLFKVRAFQTHIMVVGLALLLILSPFILNEASYLALFIIGIAFQNLSSGKGRKVMAIPVIASMSILALIGAHYRAIDLGFSGVTAAALLFALIGLFTLLTLSSWSRINIGWVRTLGLITYPLYLLHSKIGTTTFDEIEMGGNWPIVIGIVMVVMVILSYLVSQFDLAIVQGPIRSKYRQIMPFGAGKKIHV